MLVLAFGPFAFVEIVTLRFSWGWAVRSWGWRMFHVSVPVTPLGQWGGAAVGAVASLSTAFPHGDYCLTCISMLGCTTDSFFSWQRLLILWPRGLSTLLITNGVHGTQTATKESQCSLCFPCFGLFCEASWVPAAPGEAAVAQAEGTACGEVPSRNIFPGIIAENCVSSPSLCDITALLSPCTSIGVLMVSFNSCH